MTELFSTIHLALIGIGALLSWIACLLVGCRLLAPDHAIVIGLSGLWIGWGVFRKLGIPAGPSVSGIEVLPGLVGTIVVLVAYLVVREMYDRWKAGSEPPPPRSLEREVPGIVRHPRD